MNHITAKRKRVVLTPKDKIKIYEQYGKGASANQLASEYNIGKSSVYDIARQKDQFITYDGVLDKGLSKNRKTMKTAVNPGLNKVLYLWFSQKRSQGLSISGPLLCEKALDFNKKLGGSDSFVASKEWLTKFKNRHAIRQVKLEGKSLSTDAKAAADFKKEFIKLLQEEGYSRNRIYNADETGLNCKALPDKTLASKTANSAPGHKVSKERVTVLVSANASDSHSLPLFVIGKAQKPRCFDNIFNLPVVYRGQKNAWMKGDLFTKWFIKDFIPNIKAHQQKTSTEEKTLLLLDNAPCHPASEVLEKEAQLAGYPEFKVMYLSSNVTLFIQPMDQGVIEKIKRMYRKEMLRKLLILDESEEGVLSACEKFNIKDCCYMLRDAWKCLTQDNLSRTWEKLLVDKEREEGGQDELQVDQSAAKFTSILQEIPGCSDVAVEDVNQWLNLDAEDVGFQLFNDDEIVSQALNKDEVDVSLEEEDTEDEGPTVSHSEAFYAWEKTLCWYEIQEECVSTKYLVLKQLPDITALKRQSSHIQTKTTDFFKE